jgi:hypothetical protein
MLGSRIDSRAGSHGVADDHGWAAQGTDESLDVARGLGIPVGIERRIAFAVPAQVGQCDSVSGGDQPRSEEPVGGAQIAQPGDEDDERSFAGHLVRDSTAGPIQVARVGGGCRCVVGHETKIHS